MKPYLASARNKVVEHVEQETYAFCKKKQLPIQRLCFKQEKRNTSIDTHKKRFYAFMQIGKSKKRHC
jgi:hypothetical protein